MQKTHSVDEYIAKHPEWDTELAKLREIMQGTGLEETIKWGAPCYVLDGTHVAGLGAFKSYVGIWFPQGALLSDPDGVLINAQSGRTRAQRQWRFSSAKEIKKTAVRRYVKEAIGLAEGGQAIKPRRNRELEIPSELAKALAANRKAGKAFDAMALGKRREYAEHIAGAKQDTTKARRLDKILPMIEQGVGLNDKYR